jgi:nitrite reductase/ring-hydroxylating ferredoxin subunit
MLKEFVKVANKEDLPQDGMISVNVEGDDILIARIGDEFFATDGWCTHAAGMLDEGYLHADTCEVECPVHEGYFDLRTGNPTNPPAEEPVTVYSVRIDGDDIFVGPK